MEEAKNVGDDLPVDSRAESEQGVDAHNGFTVVPGPDRDALLRSLQESEARYRALINATAEIVWVVGRRSIVPGELAAWCSFTGQDEAKYSGRAILEAIHPDDREHVVAIWREAVASTHPYVDEYRLRRYDGVYRLFRVRGIPVFDAEGHVQEWIGICRDITEQRQMREYLQQAEKEAVARAQQLEAVLEAMTDLVVVYDSVGRIIYASKSAQEIFPLAMQPDYYTLPHDERVPTYGPRGEHGQPLTREQWPLQRLLNGEVLNGDKSIDVVFYRVDGREVQFSVSGSPMRDAGGQIIGCVVIAHDVTQRRHLERRTQQALEGLLAMAESLVLLPEMSDDLSVVGKRMAELTCSVLGCQRVGLYVVESTDEVLRPVAVVGLSAEQERSWWAEQQQESSLSSNPHPELIATLRAGEIIVLDLEQPPFNEQPNPYNIKVMLVAPMCIGERLVGLLTLDYGGEGHTYKRDELLLASAVAKLAALVVERQRLLRERAESQGRELALSEANRRMEEFLGVASHELRTPLTTIKANIQLALRRLKGLTQSSDTSASGASEKVGAAQEMLVRAERQVGVLNRLVGDLIDISRIQTGKLQLHLRHEPCDLAEIVRETVQEQRKTVPGRIIQLSLSEGDIVPVIADPDRIAQVLTNYLGNALKYSLSEKPVEVCLTLDEGMARVSVRDEGPGLSPGDQEHIWQCFYQAEEIKVLSGSGVGLGLGLYISQTIITRHQGLVGVNSVRGEGSTFWFTLPLAQAATTMGEQGYEVS